MKTCFVIMPIGQIKDVVSESELKSRYTDLIKGAILAADSTLEVTRADEVAAPGVINTDILTRLMHSDLVVADITFPNPNVFYELGMRHAVRSGTILLRGSDAVATPFDVAHLRHIQYENTATGLRVLSAEIGKQIAWFEANPGKPDNSFLELAHVTKYDYPNFSGPEASASQEVDIMMRLMMSETGRGLLTEAQKSGNQLTIEHIASLMQSEPGIARDLMQLVVRQQGGAFGKKKQ